MVLTQGELEAKVAALEDRISFLSQATDSLEWRFEHGIERWTCCAAELQEGLAALSKQVEQIRRRVLSPRRR